MRNAAELKPLIDAPREDLGVEYKAWLNLSENSGRATLAKALIALANHGGGFLILGFDEKGETLTSIEKPTGIPEVSQDLVNSTVRRFSTPEFHCEVHFIACEATGNQHPIICVPRDITEPVMSKRDCEGIIMRNRCYIRKPGPRSEEPQSSEEWRALITRCVRASREDMLDSIRSIVSGRIDSGKSPQSAQDDLSKFCEVANRRWRHLTATLPERAPSRFPNGYYEMAFALVGNEPAKNLSDLQRKLQKARQIRMTGWSPFLELTMKGWEPYPHNEGVEAWVGRPEDGHELAGDSAHSDFWRADRSGKLYTIRGYTEDGLKSTPPGTVIDLTLPVWRVGEAAYFTSRYAEQFEDVESIAMRVTFKGLNGRVLSSISGRRMMTDRHTSRTDEIQLDASASLMELRDNMVEVIHGMLSPLYELFNFFPLSQALVQDELERLSQGRF